ncbi:MAG: hypothetical protein COV31_02910 [Candidatus Yanofskybacteria bacterium CG10_big_fil_rev_8_21_14_0_10_46_23]|uniref:Uncharacterized protein n=1 Tax=Candidatus Yanofskybacteria bacterium CG10_big_fil_rev_8_21_14_0_10_46_23 TaxID=1975098 RepID=A0A2H0R3G6_9BACT|nr:MAG: hypothetical protein COV31_02910 [Candidatus Yanofskybacteria bacterium CG10_big_fil_rev_8_21_14_0_10_46_23]
MIKKITTLGLLIFGGLLVSLFLGTTTQAVSPADCLVEGIFIPSGQQAVGWYKEGERPEIEARIIFKNPQDCLGKTLTVSLTEEDQSLSTVNDDHVPAIRKRTFRLDRQASTLILKLRAGEDECDKNSNSADCRYYLTLSGSGIPATFSIGKNGGELLYNCEGACDNSWDFLGSELVVGGGSTGGNSGNDLGPLGLKDNSFRIEPPGGVPSTLEGVVDLIRSLLLEIAIPIGVVLIVVAGIIFMTSGGNPARVTKAKSILGYAIVGLAILLIGGGAISLIISLLRA